jgi:shikimate kinase
MGKNIVLIGFMGTGKSSIGTRLAQKLKMDFIDMDREIESVIGMSVAEIFKRYGELRFRSEERLVASKVGKRVNTVIATGGGTFLVEDNIAALRENGIIIGLEADPEDIINRVNRKKGTRPLLKRDANVKDVEELLSEREAAYSRADIRINTSGKELDTVVNEIIQILNSKA